MKRAARLIALAGASLAAVGAYASTEPLDLFVKTIAGQGDGMVTSVKTTQDHGFVVTGYTHVDSGGRHLFVAKLDSQGNPVWSPTIKVYARDDSEGHDVIETHDGNFIVAGFTDSEGAGKDWLLLEYGPSGDFVWARTWAGSGHDEAHGIVEAFDHTVWVTGFTTSFTTGRKEVVLGELSPAADNLVCARAGKLGWDFSGAAVAEVFGDYGGFCVVGSALDDNLLYDDRYVLLAKFSRAPEFWWADWIGTDTWYERGTSLVRTSDAGLAVAGWGDDDFYGNAGFLIKFDPDAQVDWARIASGAWSYPKTLRSVTETEDGSLVAVGSYTDNSMDDWLLIAKWGLVAGEARWTRGLGGFATLCGHSVVEDADHSLLVTGETPEGDALLARCCCTGLTCVDDVDGPSFSSWSPNQDRFAIVLQAQFTVALDPLGSGHHLPPAMDTVCSSTIHTVYPDGPGTIQDAIDAAANGDVIELSNGEFAGPGNRDLDFHGKCLTVRSQSGDPEDCVIDCEHAGRGFYFHSGEEPCGAVVQGITITDTIDFIGGGIYCIDASPTITQCNIEGSNWNPSGIACVGGHAEITSCRIEGWDAGIDCQFASPRVEHCVIVENSNDGIRLQGADAEINHCTIACNYNCGISLMYSSAVLGNSILWENGEQICILYTEPPSSSIEVYCSDVEDGWSGSHNIYEDPQFCDQRPCGAADRDYHLSKTSPCAPAQQPLCGLIGALDVGCCPELGDSGKGCSADIVPNNGDGFWDYYDDGDCDVDLADLAQLLSNYGCMTGCTHEMGDVWPETGDGMWEDGVDGDGLIDLNDLAELLSQYGDDCN